MVRVLLGIVIGLVLAPLAVLGWLKLGNVPVAVGDKPLPQERMLVSGPLHTRIDKEMVQVTPIPGDESDLIAGAQVYRDQCAVCHGMHGMASKIGEHMYPDAPQVWEVHYHGSEAVMGVTDDPPGETYWKVANGIRLTGMPSYRNVLSETQMWQVSLLLAHADKPLPPAAWAILRREEAPAAATLPVSKK
jgi:mono/diheme cytochrome c family protein